MLLIILFTIFIVVPIIKAILKWIAKLGRW